MQSDNPHIPLTSTRLEALGALRALQALASAGWEKASTATMDNESTVKRFAKHTDEKQRRHWRRADHDIWQAFRALDTTSTKMRWVRGHPERRKHPADYDRDETRNVAMDKAAETHYADLTTDRPWLDHPGNVAIDNFPLGSNIKEAINRHVKNRITLEFIARRTPVPIDTHIMEAAAAAETRAGLITKSLRITHVLWATNAYLNSCGRRESHNCPLCNKPNETNNHLKSVCSDDAIEGIRSKMILDISATIENDIGDSMPTEVWESIAALWSKDSLSRAFPPDDTPLPAYKCKNCRARPTRGCAHRGKPGHRPPSPSSPHPSSDSEEEDELLGPVVADCLLDMKKAGARTTWSGWFPRSFAKLLSEFDIPPDEAVNTAKSVRSIITNGMDEIWRERNSVQHDPNARVDINPKIDSAHERKLQLGLDNGPHATSSDVKKLPHSMKTKWLANATSRIATCELQLERKKKAALSFTTGSAPSWNNQADTAKISFRATAPPSQTPHKTPKTPKATPTQKSPWDNTPTAADVRSRPSAHRSYAAAARRRLPTQQTLTVAARSSPAAAPRTSPPAASAAAAANRRDSTPSSASIRLPPSSDLPRRRHSSSRPNTPASEPARSAPIPDPLPDANSNPYPTCTSLPDDPAVIDDVI